MERKAPRQNRRYRLLDGNILLVVAYGSWNTCDNNFFIGIVCYHRLPISYVIKDRKCEKNKRKNMD